MADLEAIVREIVRDELARSAPRKVELGHVTVAEYARTRSISQSTVRAAIKEQRLSCLRIGRAVRIPADAQISPPKLGVTPDEATTRARAVLLRGKVG